MNRRGFFGVLAGLLGWGAVSTRGLATPSPQPRRLTYCSAEMAAITPNEIRALRGRNKPCGNPFLGGIVTTWRHVG